MLITGNDKASMNGKKFYLCRMRGCYADNPFIIIKTGGEYEGVIKGSKLEKNI